MTATNLKRYEADLEKLIAAGGQLQNAMSHRLAKAEFRKAAEEAFKNDKERVEKFINELPNFNETYDTWFSEAYVLIKQLLPDRASHFNDFYERPKNRKEMTWANYSIQDYIEGLHREGHVRQDAAASKLQQQVAILTACKARFSSSLFEIRQLVQADLFDSEIDAARELSKHGFGRAAGAIAGVVLEKHLKQVCEDHKVKVTKKNPGINDLNQLLKDNSVITVPQWRHITLLGDIRNLCDHSKTVEPTKEQIADLLDGTDKVLKTIA